MALQLTGGTIVRTLAPVRLERTDLLIVDGRVASPENGAALPAVSRDCSGCLIVPGNVCAHTHLYSALARGMPFRLQPPSNFVEILRRIWWRLDRALDEDAVRWSALAGGVDALRCGTTTVVDHHASPNAIDGSLDVMADALESLGIRSVLCYEVTDRDGPERAAAGVRENERFLASAATRARTRAQVGAHASFTLSDDTLAACVDLAERGRAGVHVHVAEDAADQRDCLDRFGLRVAERLSKAGVSKPGSLLAHCIHLDEGEAESIRESGASVAHNPTSNMNNSVGHARVLALGERVALGTDGIGADMFAESKAAYFRARDDDVSFPIDWPLARLAEGANVAGRSFGEPSLGSLETGAPADLVVLDYASPTPVAEGNLPGHLAFGLSSRFVRDVVVAGEVVVEDRRLSKVDQAELAAKAAVAAERLWQRMDQLGEHEWGGWS